MMKLGGGHRTAGLLFELFLNITGLFLKVKIQNCSIFWVLLTFNYFGGMPDTSDIFGGKQ